MDDLEIVDAHHLWDLKRLRYPWLEGEPDPHFFLGDTTPLRHDYLPEDYFRDSRHHKVVKTVHIEAECDRATQVEETRWLTEINARYGMPNAIVGHAWFDTGNTEEILAGHKQFPLVRGIRSKPRVAPSPDKVEPGAPGTMGDPKWRAGFALLEKYDLSWDLRVPFWHLREAADVARSYPGIRIALNHTGLPWDRSPEGLAAWRAGMRALAAAPNVSVKISGLGLKGQPWTLEGNRRVILDTIELFGIDRCMFASNFPVDGLRADFDLIFGAFKQVVADFPRADQEKLFAGNAKRFYRIEP